MRAMWLTVAAVVLAVPALGFAQALLPPIVPGPNEGPALPGGAEVSRPLTPVEIPAPPVPDPDAKPDPVQRLEDVQQPKPTRRGPLGPAWYDLEFLLWWSKATPVPPLVTATRTGTPPVLGSDRTSLLIGRRAIDNQDIAGGRFTLGGSVNEEETVGFELGYFFLGSRTIQRTINDFGNSRVLGLPYINALTGNEDVFLTSAPGVAAGSVFASTTTRVQGAEANGIVNLYDDKGVRINGIVGYRFLQVQEGLTLAQMRYTPTNFGPIYDEFDGSNRFNGGQLGLHADLSRGMLFCELTGKIALGQNYEVVRIDGVTALHTPLPSGILNQSFQGGVYALPTNIGRYTRSAFAVVPEGTIKVGVKLSDSGRFFVGYNFLYLSDAVRPGDQIDRTLNPAQIPALNPTGAGSLASPERPTVLINRSDFWTQGLLIGFETRY